MKKDPIRFLLIFDDSLSKETTYSNTINRVFTHGRHTHIVPIILQQSISQVHPDWKRNCDIFFAFKPRTLADKEWYHNNILESETKSESFDMMQTIPKYCSLVVDFSSGETQTYLFRAPLISVKE